MYRIGVGSRFASNRRSSFSPALRESPVERARTTLARAGEVTVVALCAERALVSLRVNPALYHAFDGGPVDARDPLNAAHFYHVRPRLPAAAR